MTEPFYIRDCTLGTFATGFIASTLWELRDTISRIPLNSIYHHFWGSRMRQTYIHPEYHNDFARWASFGLHDYVLSERLGILDPTSFSDLEALRMVLLDVLDERLEETEYAFWTIKEEKFHFLRSVLIVYNAELVLSHPSELARVIPTLLPTMVFYHFIDARKRTQNGKDDFSAWLMSFPEDYKELIYKIEHIDPYFNTLIEVKQKLIEIIHEFFP